MCMYDKERRRATLIHRTSLTIVYQKSVFVKWNNNAAEVYFSFECKQIFNNVILMWKSVCGMIYTLYEADADGSAQNQRKRR